MIELSEKESEIARELKLLDGLLGQFKPGRQAQAKAIRTNIEILRDDVEYFELTLETLEATDKSALQRLLAGFKASLAEAEERFAKKLGADAPAARAGRPGAFDPSAELARVNAYDMSKLQLFDLGDGLLDRALARLQRINCTLGEDNRLVEQANETLLGQAERLERANEQLLDTRSVLGQAGKVIAEMVNDFYKDKFLLGLAALILVLVIAVVAVGIVRKTKKSATTTTTAATNSTATTNATATNATAAADVWAPTAGGLSLPFRADSGG